MAYQEWHNSRIPANALQVELEFIYPAGTVPPGVKALRQVGYTARAGMGGVIISQGDMHVVMVLCKKRQEIYGYASVQRPHL